MIGLLLSYTHLLGHKGLTRMLANLEPYYFPTMYTVTKNFIECCYSCFLTNKGNRKQKVGIYPTPSYPFEEIIMDLAENLNTINGFSHLLIIQCVFSDFVVIVPLKSKQASEVTRALFNSIFQQFNVRRIHSDNGPAFRSTSVLQILAALNIEVINSSALHPAGRGQVERLVSTVKLMLKRMLAIKSDLNWEYLPYIISKILNTTVSPKTGFSPQEMVFGKNEKGDSLFDTERLTPPHHLVQNNAQYIANLTADIHKMSNVAKEKLTELRLISNEKINQHRTAKNFQPNQYVFVLDRYNAVGNPRVLRTKFHPSPYIVIRPLFTTCLVKRLADGYISLYSNEDLKAYDAKSPLFADLPKEISKVLLHDFQNLIASDFSTITKFDKLSIPTGIQLFDSKDNSADQEQPLDINTGNYPNNKSDNVPLLVDEFYPELPPDNLTPPLPQVKEKASKIIVDANIPTQNNSNSVPTQVEDTLPPNLDSEETQLLTPFQNINEEDLQADLDQLNDIVEDIPPLENDPNSDNEDSDSDSDKPAMTLRSGRRKVSFK